MNWLSTWKQKKRHHEKAYDELKQHATFCWCCGRGLRDQPVDWHAPWLIHRAHIVNNPRLKDRRVVNLLCPLCHDNYDGTGDLEVKHMLALKAIFDPKWFDITLLQRCSIRILPINADVPQKYRLEYMKRRRLTRGPVLF